MKIKTIITAIVAVLFFTVMIFLTFSARAIHNASLPLVTAEKLPSVQFPFEYTDESGNVMTGTKSALAIRTELLDSDIFILYQREKNGDLRYYVRLAEIETGAENNGFTEVLSGIGYGDKVVVNTDKELYDGCEVCANNVQNISGNSSDSSSVISPF